MRVSKGSTPVSSADGENAEFCDDDGGADGGGDFFGGFDPKADVAF